MNTKKKNKINAKKLDTEIKLVQFRDIEETELNAQEMKQDVFNRLVKNIKTDGCLTSLPLIMKQEGKKYKCISGHHRIKAGILESECIIIPEVNKSTRLRLQLSHNDIGGTSNEEVLLILQQELNNEDLVLVDNIENIEYDTTEDIDYTPPTFRYINIALIEESRESLVDMILNLGNNSQDVNWLIEKEQYNKVEDLLTLAFEKGFKTPGQAFGKFLEIIQDNKHLIER